jgi:hypothetical protein
MILRQTNQKKQNKDKTMDITKGNFVASVPGIEALIDACDFAAIDLEMTGIEVPAPDAAPGALPLPSGLKVFGAAENESNSFGGGVAADDATGSDVASPPPVATPVLDAFAQLKATYSIESVIGVPPFRMIAAARRAEWPLAATPLEDAEASYQLRKRAAERYSIIQVGLCLFRLNDGATAAASSANGPPEFTAWPLNFFVFPAGAEGGTGNAGARSGADVTMSADAVAFLRKHGMNWSQWVNAGVPFVDAAGEAALIAAEKQQLGKQTDAALTRAAADTARRMVDVASGGDAARSAKLLAWVDASLVAARRVFIGDTDEARAVALVLPPGHAHALPLIASASACHALAAEVAADPTLRDLVYVSVRNAPRRGRAPTVGAENEAEATLVRRAATLAEDSERRLMRQVGFRRIFARLVRRGVPLVGHNCFSDWLFLYQAFVAPLPPTLAEFKAGLRAMGVERDCVFYDTKILSGGAMLPKVSPNVAAAALAAGGTTAAVSGGADAASPASAGAGVYAAYANSPVVPPVGMPNYYPTWLGGLFNAYGGLNSPRITVQLPLGFGGYQAAGSGGGDDKAHEAGYDALMTGCALLNMFHELDYTRLERAGNSGTRNAAVVAPSYFEAARNKIAMFRSLYTLDMEAGAPDVYLPGEGYELVHFSHPWGQGGYATLQPALDAIVVHAPFVYSLSDTEVVAAIGPGTTLTGAAVGDASGVAAADAAKKFEKACDFSQLKALVRAAAAGSAPENSPKSALELLTDPRVRATRLPTPHAMFGRSETATGARGFASALKQATGPAVTNTFAAAYRHRLLGRR